MGFENNWREKSNRGPMTFGDPGKYQPFRRHQTQAAPTWQQTFARAPLPGYAADVRRQAAQRLVPNKLGLTNIAEDRIFVADGRTAASTRYIDRPVGLCNNRADRLQKHEFRQGLIFKAPLHQEDSQPDKPVPASKSKARSMTAYGIVFSVPRYMIVVALNEATYISVPLYTHEHTGLAGKEHYQNEFVSVRDGRLPAASFGALSKYEPVVTTGKGDEIDNQSVAYFGNPVARRYDLPITRCGYLTEESAKQLATLFQREMNRALGLK